MTLSMIDTIVAVATPPGRGGVGIVRISGPQSWTIGQQIFRRQSHADRPLRSHRLYYGHAHDPITGAVLDEGMIAYMRGPHSYTGEDSVEINAHGAPVVLRRLVESALACGARAAEPGEMTLRAFLHGRIDLAQAEAVADLVAANSETAARQALDHLAGHLSATVQEARTAVLRALAPIEASIDFPEDEVPTPDPTAIQHAIMAALAIVEQLLAGAERGRVIREGIRCVIAGRPNVGKSSLLNALLHTARAIVTPVAGTTRDTIEETAIIEGIACHLIDTAGIIATDDPIERLGIARSHAAMHTADIALFVLDRAQPLTEADDAVLAALTADAFGTTHRPLILVANKSDLPQQVMESDIAALLARHGLSSKTPVITTSLIDGTGQSTLEQTIVMDAAGDITTADRGVVGRARHREALRQAQAALIAAQVPLTQPGPPLDLVAEDLHDALQALGMITGESITDDLLETIFHEFCIGK